ncbi:DUF1838 family protein [Glacieibacterium frigidum]|uniref:DUF1838 domain-containing protein n=1 Tax=Glacieibacterium frigidum TaxID=2593303 RepID=A0A552U8D4_9SPHN|nr:DUF1838 family protein [Glacieibacterium frigidum]TRW14449.1 DUF1838 domain-containing protein [Glacieibacterium frigidum]
MTELLLTRRAGLGLAALGAGLAAAPALGAPKVDFVSKIDFKDPKWNRDTFVRLDADLDPTKEKVGWIKGQAMGVRPNEAVRPLFGVEGFSVVRTKRLPDGSWRRMLREIVFYRDLKTGQLMDSWLNPYSNETVRVVPIANDPFNFTIGEFYPDPPSYGGLQTVKPPKRPYLLDWSYGPEDTIVLQTGINMMYPNALRPDKWPRESSGWMNRVSEHFTYVAKREDVANPRLTHVPHVGSWSRITPWLPWMLMGQAEGHVVYNCSFFTVPSVAGVATDVREKARAMDAKWLSAPTEDYGPSLSSLENYARFQQPAPVPVGWTPPVPPPPAGPRA